MFINLEADYAIRIVHALANEKNRMDAKSIAAKTGVTPKYTLKILHGLVSANIAKSYKGANGGYTLARPAEEITLLEVVEQVCGPIEINLCQSSGECTHPKGICRFYSVFKDASEFMKEKFGNITFAEKNEE